MSDVLEPDSPAPVKESILLVDDDTDFCQLVSALLCREDVTIVERNCCESALSFLRTGDTTSLILILLDVRLTDGNGIDFCEKISEIPWLRSIPVVMCSSEDHDADIILSLEKGADDYIVKSFKHSVFVAKIRSLLRRERMKRNENIRLKNLEYDPRAFRAVIDGKSLEFTPSEGRLFELLLRNACEIVDRPVLLNTLAQTTRSSSPRALNVHLSRLRKKLAACGPTIEAERGRGYRLRFNC